MIETLIILPHCLDAGAARRRTGSKAAWPERDAAGPQVLGKSAAARNSLRRDEMGIQLGPSLEARRIFQIIRLAVNLCFAYSWFSYSCPSVSAARKSAMNLLRSPTLQSAPLRRRRVSSPAGQTFTARTGAARPRPSQPQNAVGLPRRWIRRHSPTQTGPTVARP